MIRIVGNDTILVANYKKYKDSILFNFKINKIDSSSNLNAYNIFRLFRHYSQQEKLLFYSRDAYKNLPPIKNFIYFSYTNPLQNFEIDSTGKITLYMKYLKKIGARKYVQGYYKGILDDHIFRELKKYLHDKEFFNYLSLLQGYDNCCYYIGKTSNFKIKRSLSFDLSPFLYSDSAWIKNQMEYYGNDENNLAPTEQLIYYSKLDSNENYYLAFSGKKIFLKKVRTLKEARYIYSFIIDSVYHTDRTNMKNDTVFIASSFKLSDDKDEIGVVLIKKTAYWKKLNPYEIYPYERYGRNSFYFVENTFPLNKQVLFDFHTSCYYTNYNYMSPRTKNLCYPRLITNYELGIKNISPIEDKVSRAIQRIKRKSGLTE